MTIGNPHCNPPIAGARLLTLVTASAAMFWGCSSSSTGQGQSATGGAASNGGTTSVPAETGGRVGTGGTVGTGGALAMGGAPSAGGTTTTTTTKGTGGSTPLSGGTPATGGGSSSGGVPSSGGIANSGGSIASSGGVATSGGAIGTGGVIGSGGRISSGGVTGTGGTIRSGGTIASGGVTVGTGGVGTGGVSVAGQTATGGTTSGAGGANNAGGYVFACFDDAAAVSSMQIYTSPDALNFTKLLDTGFGGPTGNLRDPSIMKYTDGNYYVVHTTPPAGTGCCGAESSFNVAKSSDLKTWTSITQVPCGVAGVKNVWAPEWFKDSDGSIHVLVSVDQKTYRYEPTDGTFTKWGAGTWIGIGPGYIDTFMVKLGTTYHAFTKLESATTIRRATSTSLDGPWTFQTDPTWGTHKEAPCLIQLANGNWRAYMDAGSSGHEMYSDSTDVFQTWTNPQTLPNVGNNISHGTVIHGN
jgi:hypothetical protein